MVPFCVQTLDSLAEVASAHDSVSLEHGETHAGRNAFARLVFLLPVAGNEVDQ